MFPEQQIGNVYPQGVTTKPLKWVSSDWMWLATKFKETAM